MHQAFKKNGPSARLGACPGPGACGKELCGKASDELLRRGGFVQELRVLAAETPPSKRRRAKAQSRPREVKLTLGPSNQTSFSWLGGEAGTEGACFRLPPPRPPSSLSQPQAP